MPSVLEPAEHLLERGWRLDTLPSIAQGVVRPSALESLLAADARRAATGQRNAGQPRNGRVPAGRKLAAICRAAGVPLHTDAVAAAGKVPVDFRDWAWRP